MTKLTFASVVAELPIVDENILNEAAKQPEKFMRAARYRVSKLRRKNVANAALEGRRLYLAMRARARGAVAGERMTEGAVKEIVESSKSVKRLRAKHDRATEWEELAKHLLEAYRHRRDSIRVIGEAQNIEAIKGTKEVERLEQNRKLRNRAIELHKRRQRLGRDEEDEE